jgi:hypothetical protein
MSFDAAARISTPNLTSASQRVICTFYRSPGHHVDVGSFAEILLR